MKTMDLSMITSQMPRLVQCWRRKNAERNANEVSTIFLYAKKKFKISAEYQEEVQRERPGQYKSAAMVASDSSTDEDFNPNKKDSDDDVDNEGLGVKDALIYKSIHVLTRR